MMGKKENENRTTRFLVTLTLFGGAWYLLKGVTKIWVNTFTEIVYSEGIINNEHIIAMSLLIVMVAITISVITYLYLEYKTYRFYDEDVKKQDAIRKADKSFEGIFSMIKMSITLAIVLASVILFVNEIKILTFLLLFIIGIILGVIYKYALDDKVKRMFDKYNMKRIKTDGKFNQIGNIIYISVVIIMLSISLMLVSFESNKAVEVKVEESSTVPIDISLNNYDNPKLEINIYRENEPNDNINLQIEENDFQRSLIEVYETNVSNENFFIKSNKNNKFPLSQNTDYYQYHSELSSYLLEGENIVEILILSNGNTSKKTVRLVTSIYLSGDKVQISKNKFKVNP